MPDQVRAARHDDLEPIKDIAVATGLFAPDETTMFDEMLHGALDGLLPDHAWLVFDDEKGAVGGAAYYAPEPFSDRLWNLYFLGVRPDRQGGGGGRALVGSVEQALRARGSEEARILLIETSGLPRFRTDTTVPIATSGSTKRLRFATTTARVMTRSSSGRPWKATETWSEPNLGVVT